MVAHGGSLETSSEPTTIKTGIESFLISGSKSYFKRSSMCDHGNLFIFPGIEMLGFSRQPVFFHSSASSSFVSKLNFTDTTVEIGASAFTFFGYFSANKAVQIPPKLCPASTKGSRYHSCPPAHLITSSKST